MRLTAMTDYALRLMIYLGQRPERLCTIAEVAQAHGISEAHLMKITHQLGLAGWITTLRGKGGGLRLAREPAAINLGDFVRSIEPDFQVVECLGESSECVLTGSCRLERVFSKAVEAFLHTLDGQTLADILPRGGSRAGRGGVQVITGPVSRKLRTVG